MNNQIFCFKCNINQKDSPIEFTLELIDGVLEPICHNCLDELENSVDDN